MGVGRRCMKNPISDDKYSAGQKKEAPGLAGALPVLFREFSSEFRPTVSAEQRTYRTAPCTQL